MLEGCVRCGGALGPATDRPPCLCELGPLETLPGVVLPEESVVSGGKSTLPLAGAGWGEGRRKALPSPAGPHPDPPVRKPTEAKGGTTEHARALRCPGCGAWLEVGARRCGFCTIELAAVRCWRCFELSFAGSAHCAACGAKLGLEADRGATEACCPVCRKEVLHLVEVGEHRIRECMGCGGVMVDHEELGSLTRKTELDAGIRLLDAGVQKSVLTETEVRYRYCPDCGVILNRRNFGQRSGVVVDVCKEHGVWFDSDELTAVLAFVASGGLKEQRDRAIDDAKRELSRRRAEALAEQSKASGAYGPDTFTVDSAAALLAAILELFR